MSRSPELLGRLDPSQSTYLQAQAERVLIFDGAMGTNLQILGLSPEDFGGPELEGCNEWLIQTRPDLISQVHRSFLRGRLRRGGDRHVRLRPRSCWSSTAWLTRPAGSA